MTKNILQEYSWRISEDCRSFKMIIFLIFLNYFEELFQCLIELLSSNPSHSLFCFVLFYFILFYFILFYFILFCLFYFIRLRGPFWYKDAALPVYRSRYSRDTSFVSTSISTSTSVVISPFVLYLLKLLYLVCLLVVRSNYSSCFL